jgi:hypothetical protein
MADAVGSVLWVAEQATKLAVTNVEFAATGNTRYKGSVTYMYLGGGMSRTLNDAVNKVVEPGTHFAVTTGDNSGDACSYSPTSAERSSPLARFHTG